VNIDEHHKKMKKLAKLKQNDPLQAEYFKDQLCIQINEFQELHDKEVKTMQ
jgi:hypothetical protein